jgi:hypothetical protein
MRRFSFSRTEHPIPLPGQFTRVHGNASGVRMCDEGAQLGEFRRHLPEGIDMQPLCKTEPKSVLE